MRPVFLVRNVQVVGTPKIVGKDHLRMKVRQNDQVFDAIGFGLGDLMGEVQNNGKSLDVVFSIDEHEWTHPSPSGPGVVTETFPQLKIKDLRRHEDKPIQVTSNSVVQPIRQEG